MTAVGIFRLRYPIVSEPFIREQTAAMQRYAPVVVTRSWEGPSAPPAGTMIVGGTGHSARARAARALYVATAAPRLFGRHSAWPRLALLHAHFGPDATYALPVARRLDIPLITSFHGWDVTLPIRSYLGRSSLTTWRYLAQRHSLRASGAAFIAVSDYIRDRLVALHFPVDRTVRLYVGVDTERFQPVASSGRERYVFSAARHTEQKGVDTLIRAFAHIAPRFSDVDLMQVGTGPLTAPLRRLAVDLGVGPRVHFLGAQPHDVVRALMQRATVVALTSQTPIATGQQEALGLVLNEAGACGVPVVATRHGGMTEAVIDGETGFLAAERDDAAIGQALTTLLEDRALAARLGARAREFVCDVFNLQTQTAALEDLYDRVIDSHCDPATRRCDLRDEVPTPGL